MKAGDILAAFAALPLAGIDSVLQGRRAMILAPHPDDESLGCGGLIAAACAAGLAPVVVVATDGGGSHPGSLTHPPRRLSQLRRAEVSEAVRILGLPADLLYCLHHADGNLPGSGPALAAAAAAVAEIATAHGCGLIIGTWAGDPHCDHVACAALAAAVARLTGAALLAYPVWGWLLPPAQQLPQGLPGGGWRLDISAYLPEKRRAIAAHRSQYGGVIDDAPQGFQLPTALLAVFDRDFEVFFTP